MKIIGLNKQTSLIHFHLKSSDLKFECYTKPVNSGEYPPFLDKGNVATIIFDDSCEIDALIHMLELFRDGNRNHFGEWR